MLASREHSAFELGQKLARKGFERDAIAEELRRLAELDLQSDARFAASFVRSRIGRGLGRVRIAQELKQRGVAPATLEQALSACPDEEAPTDWFAQCAEVARRRFGDAPPQDIKERAKRARFLQYRGFSPSQIARVLRGDSDE